MLMGIMVITTMNISRVIDPHKIKNTSKFTSVSLKRERFIVCKESLRNNILL